MKDKRTPLQNAISSIPPSPNTVQIILDFLPSLINGEEDRIKMLENKDEVGGTALISAG